MRIAAIRYTLASLIALLSIQAAGAQPPDLAVRNKAASAAMSQGRFDEAAAIYRELLQSLPNEAGLHLNLGMALAMGGHEAEAVPALERAIALNPKLTPAHAFLGSSYLALGEPHKAIPPLERAVAAQPTDIENRRLLAQAYTYVGRSTDAVTQLRRVTELAPKLPAAWYALGHGYNALTQDAMSTFDREPDDSPWKRLLLADALLADGRLTDAFANYREVLHQLPAMIGIHESIARIYEQTGHADWAATERSRAAATPVACANRRAFCEFRARRYRAALAAALGADDPESRYWRARAATELALSAFKQLDALPDSRERREVRATLASSERRYRDAIAELEAARKFAPDDPGLLDDLGTSYYLARDFEKAVELLAALVRGSPDDPRLLTIYGDVLLQLDRVDEALPILRRAAERAASEPMPRLALARALVQKGEFAAAVPLIEAHLAGDHDGSLHAQLARAYNGLGDREKATALLERSRDLQRAAQERSAAIAQRTITPPK